MTRFVPIELDRPRRLRFDANALADLEGVMGMGLSRIMSEEQIGVRAFRAMIWAGLKWEDRGLTLERAGRILMAYIERGGSLTDLGKRVNEAMKAAGWMRAQPTPEELEMDEEEQLGEDSDEGNEQGA